MDLLRKFVLWSYSRETSVYVIFCLLIVAFIFLTPKAWFDKREALATQTSLVIVQEKDFSRDRSVMERKIKDLTGRADAEIVATRERRNGSGEVYYEIDIQSK
jgi:hypothetical protein